MVQYANEGQGQSADGESEHYVEAGSRDIEEDEDSGGEEANVDQRVG
jgi:hypothetical protein